jgi:hypothetical protein
MPVTFGARRIAQCGLEIRRRLRRDMAHVVVVWCPAERNLILVRE